MHWGSLQHREEGARLGGPGGGGAVGRARLSSCLASPPSDVFRGLLADPQYLYLGKKVSTC